MSQINIQSLLQNEAIAPTEVQRNPIEYKESSFQGGTFKPGEMSKLPAKSSEQYLYESLSEIAGGVSKSLDIFADISNRMEKEKIQKIENEWDTIDVQDIDPREKIKQFNKVLSTASTPILGESWKTQITNRMAKSWGKEAYESFVEKEFTQQAKEWKEYDGKMGLDKTAKFLTEFEKNNPSLTGSTFIRSLKKQNEAGLEERSNELVANTMVLSLQGDLDIDQGLMVQIMKGEAGLEDLSKINPRLAGIFQKAVSMDDEEEFRREFYNKDFFGPLEEQLKTYTPDVRFKVQERLSSVFATSAKQIWQTSRGIKQSQLERERQSLVMGAGQTFIAAPTEDSLSFYSKQLHSIFPDLTPEQQLMMIPKVYEELFSGYNSNKFPGYPNFSELPVSEKFAIVDKAFEDNFSGPLTGDAFMVGLGGGSTLKVTDRYGLDLRTRDGLIKYARTAFSVSENGRKVSGEALNTVAKTANNQINLKQLDETLPFEKAVGEVLNKFAVQGGITPEEASKLYIEVKDVTQPDGTVVKQSRFVARTPEEMYKDFPDIVKKLNDRFIFADDLRAVSATLAELQDGFSQVERKTGSSSSDRKLSLEPPKYRNVDDAKNALLTNPEISVAFQRNTEAINRGETSFEDQSANFQEDYLKLAEARIKVNTTLNHAAKQSIIEEVFTDLTEEDQEVWVKSNKEPKVSLTTPEQETLDSINEKIENKMTEVYGQPSLDFFDPKEQITPESLKKYKWEDETQTLTPAGRRLGLKLQVKAQAIANAPNLPGSASFVAELRDNISAIAMGDVSTIDAGVLYPVLYAMKGFASTGTYPAGLFGKSGQTDESLMTRFMQFMGSYPIPNSRNSTQINERANAFYDGVTLLSETIAASPSLSQTKRPFFRDNKPLSVREAAIQISGEAANGKFTTIGNSNGYDKKELNPSETKASATIDFANFLGIGTGDANTDLNNIFGLLSPLFTRNGSIYSEDPERNSGREYYNILPPNYQGDLVVTIPNVGPKKFKDALPDEKLAFYMSNAQAVGSENLIVPMLLSIASAQTIPQDEIRDPLGRVSAVKALVAAQAEYNKFFSMQSRVPAHSVSFTGGTGFFNFGDSVFSMDQNTNLPIPINGQRRLDYPHEQRFAATKHLTGANGFFPTFNEMMEDPGINDNGANEELIERVGRLIHHGQEGFDDISKGLDPADQLVVGLMSAKAIPENVYRLYLLLANASGEDIHVIDEAEEDIIRGSLFGANWYNDSRFRDVENLSAMEALEMLLSPEDLKPLEKAAKDFNLGLGRKSKIKFDLDQDQTKAQFTFYETTPNNTVMLRAIDVDLFDDDKYLNTSSFQKTSTSSYTRYLRTLERLVSLQRIKEPVSIIEKVKREQGNIAPKP